MEKKDFRSWIYLLLGIISLLFLILTCLSLIFNFSEFLSELFILLPFYLGGISYIFFGLGKLKRNKWSNFSLWLMISGIILIFLIVSFGKEGSILWGLGYFLTITLFPLWFTIIWIISLGIGIDKGKKS